MIDRLPRETREQVHALIVERCGGWEDLSDLIKRRLGVDVSKSALHRYGRKFESRLDAVKMATEQARAMAKELGDDEDALGEATVRLLQTEIFNVMMAANAGDGELDLKMLARSAATLTRAGVGSKKHAAEVRRARKDAAAATEKVAKKNGLAPNIAKQMRDAILQGGA